MICNCNTCNKKIYDQNKYFITEEDFKFLDKKIKKFIKYFLDRVNNTINKIIEQRARVYSLDKQLQILIKLA